MKVLIACECSGEVRRAFRALGIDAWSCDLQPSEDDSPYHIIGDAMLVIRRGGWDLIIAHPPCTFLSVSGSRWFKQKARRLAQIAAFEFFMRIALCDCPRIAIENPVCVMSSRWRKPDQIIQPWMFGHPEKKATCFWLKNVPPPVTYTRREGENALAPRRPI
jgi:site-specific DNA-cytosine methylase